MQNPEGNKAANLTKLLGLGYRVPAFIVVDRGTVRSETEEEVEKNLRGTELFAVRSSSSSEDSAEHARAGKYYSKVAVTKENLFAEFQKVVKSFAGASGAVIIQKFIPCDKSGVLFTNDGHDRMLLNANFGLCQQVVEGFPSDEWILDTRGRIISSRIPSEKTYLTYTHGSIRSATATTPSLTNKEIRALFKLGHSIEKKLGAPQDIEWCFYSDDLYLLQARPVTRSIPRSPALVHYDSANIAESYSGIVLPLTLSFAKQIYQVVYTNLLHASGVRLRKLKKYPDVFGNMVSWFYGRLYYNMNNWYKMMSFVPGYQRNKVNLERMITSNIRLEVPKDILPPFWFRIGYPLIVIFKLLIFNRTQRLFRTRVKTYLEEFRKLDISQYSPGQCKALYDDLNKKLLNKWHIPVENDFMVMTFFGILQKRIADDTRLQSAIRFRSKTGEQINALIRLSKAVYSAGDMRKKGSAITLQEFKEIDAGDHAIRQLLREYFDEFGGRYANELKLESKDIEEDAERLLAVLNLYKDREPENFAETGCIKTAKRFDLFLVKRFRKYASSREEMRLLRSNCFSMVRKLMKRMGEVLKEQSRIMDPDDVFYLFMDEVFAEGEKMQGIIAERKRQYLQYEHQVPPPYFTIPVGSKPDLLEGKDNHNRILYGIACSSGKIKGRVRVFREFYFPGDIDFDIVVAQHTDPGWTPLLGIAKGLIVQHGGILSHAAIVSRELQLPTVIGIDNVMNILENGMCVELDGDNGKITLLNENK